MKNLNRIHLSGLRAVEAVGRLGSLKAAAEELGVTIGAVSQQVQKVEGQLARPLFERRARGLSPLASALPILSQLTHGMSALSTAVDMASRERSGMLTVSAAPVFAGKWLVWHLKSFSKAHPDIRVRVEASVALTDPSLSDVDLCIRVGRGPYPGLKATKLLDQRIFPVCSPVLAQTFEKPEDMFKLPVILDPGQMFTWEDWLQATGRDRIQLQPGPSFSDGALCLDAAVAGQGVFLAWETLAYYALTSGQLVRPFPDMIATGISYWLLHSPHKPFDGPARAFSDWLRKELPQSLELPPEI
ncbi:LysR substrate-binding domain-containing protein [Roseibium sp.]|uniref:LysR substrate-binding domain-containing protein n=1 Tax=Roseibium sp. TaxID=1936156 RepID=UPI003A982B27